MHVHVSALNFLIVWAYIIIGLFLIKLATSKYPDNTYAKAVAFLVS
jgi:hypothetical protein